MERVVVTGLGVVSCVGNDVPSFWEALVAGRSGIAPITAYDASQQAVRIAGEVKAFQFDARLGKRMARFAQLAFSAAQQALRQAGLEPDAAGAMAADPERVGVAIGSGIGGEPFLEEQYKRFLERGPGKFHPLTVPIVIANMAAANVAIHHHLGGPNLCISTACATGNHNIAAAMDLIRLGRADAMVAGGAESTVSAFAVDGYHQLRALSTRNDDPLTASRPFSRERDGFVLAEGAGVVVLESLSHAKARGAEILAEAAGYGINADAYHLTAPHPEGRGAMQCMRLALQDAALNPQDVSYINAHGTSTPLNDALETRAIKEIWGEHARSVPVSSIKSMVGHGLGAAAGLEAVACVLALRHGVIPPTINLDDPDPELDLDYVPHTARETPLRAVLSNSFAFGGHNAVVAFRRLD
jgi:3-oxoacyl-[acyl-carrier-protein] synthase II